MQSEGIISVSLDTCRYHILLGLIHASGLTGDFDYDVSTE